MHRLNSKIAASHAGHITLLAVLILTVTSQMVYAQFLLIRQSIADGEGYHAGLQRTMTLGNAPLQARLEAVGSKGSLIYNRYPYRYRRHERTHGDIVLTGIRLAFETRPGWPQSHHLWLSIASDELHLHDHKHR